MIAHDDMVEDLALTEPFLAELLYHDHATL